MTFRGVDPEYVWIDASAPGHGAVEHAFPIEEDPSLPVHHTMMLPPGAPVSGTVLDPDGKPVPSASVHIATVDSSAWHRDSTPIRADANGAWTLEGLAAGSYSLTADSALFGRSPPVPLKVDGKSASTGIVLRVDYGAQLVGTVFDASGQPAPGAAIQLKSTTHNWSARADEHGVFRLLGMPADSFVIAASKGTQSSERYSVDLEVNKRVDVELRLVESSIAGVVVDSKGEPVAGARVSVRRRERFQYWGRRDLTDSAGNFEMGGVPPGEYDVEARRAGQSDGEMQDPDKVVKAGDRSVRLVLAGLTTLKGRVVLDGNPVRSYGLIVAARDTGSGDTYWRQTSTAPIHSADGRFVKEGVPAGPRTIVIGGEGFAQKVMNVEIPEGDTFDLGDIVVDRGQVVSGRVTDANGAPVAGATVLAEQRAGVMRGDPDPLERRMLGGALAVTDADGSYQLIGIPPPVKYSYEPSERPNRISARHPQRGSAPSRKLAPTETRVDFVLAETGGIDGKVVGARSDHVYVLATALARKGDPVPTQIASDRTFRFDSLPIGEYELSLAKPNREGFFVQPIRVKVLADKRLTAAISIPEGVSLQIKVIDGTCHTVVMQDAASVAASPATALGEAACDGASAEMKGVPPGRYRLCVDEKPCVPVTVTASPAKQFVEFRN